MDPNNQGSQQNIQDEEPPTSGSFRIAAINVNSIATNKKSNYAPTTNSSAFIQELEKLFKNFNLENYDNSYIIAGDLMLEVQKNFQHNDPNY